MWSLPLPLSSQTTARRNAHRAAIECGIRRRQREEADEYLARHRARRDRGEGRDPGAPTSVRSDEISLPVTGGRR
jgi:hypothetical protein